MAQERIDMGSSLLLILHLTASWMWGVVSVVASRDSFKYLRGWLEDIHQNAGSDLVVTLVGNKGVCVPLLGGGV